MPIKVQKLGKNAQALGAAPKLVSKKKSDVSRTFSDIQPASWDVRCEHLHVIAPLKSTSTHGIRDTSNLSSPNMQG